MIGHKQKDAKKHTFVHLDCLSDDLKGSIKALDDIAGMQDLESSDIEIVEKWFSGGTDEHADEKNLTVITPSKIPNAIHDIQVDEHPYKRHKNDIEQDYSDSDSKITKRSNHNFQESLKETKIIQKNKQNKASIINDLYTDGLLGVPSSSEESSASSVAQKAKLKRKIKRSIANSRKSKSKTKIHKKPTAKPVIVSIEYSKTGRAKCNGGCEARLIDQGLIRLSISKKFYHYQCVDAALLSGIDSIEDLNGSHALKPADKVRVAEWLADIMDDGQVLDTETVV
jgi:hypothetical protein